MCKQSKKTANNWLTLEEIRALDPQRAAEAEARAYSGLSAKGGA
jgi:hypothetical protein